MKNKRIVLNEGESLTIRLRGGSEYEVTLQYEDVDDLLLHHLGWTHDPPIPLDGWTLDLTNIK